MPAATEFPLFTRLPIDLRLFIWEFAILDHNRDRLVPINEETKRVICIANIANSLFFRVTSESRKVSQQLYHIRLPVFWKVHAPDPQHRAVDENMEDNPDECHGHIYISSKHDTFVFGLDRLAPHHIDEHWWLQKPLGGPPNFGWRSAGLTQPQCLKVRRIMLFNSVNTLWLKDGCHNTLRCAVRCGALDGKAWHDEGAFPGVQECIYVPLEGEAYWESVYLYAYMLDRPGHRVLARLGRGNHLVFFDKEQITEARNQSSVCVCNDEEIREREVTW
ncbi:uncharacterized protein F4822DRAFT_58027 [Hypoxylon trugodes]|uniref:uncharacterized protein n=1 Tax=Hypoxylon trugodes TaxID=326681 RepID=UPI002197CEDB|nr:uncharacterized protein F4822DRAFT_58027 [Hypoxylon trugodes]KAI1383988.1 hypothetical protein F4822DRAFT_58027 [Hypoxylon trugodes]